MHTRHGLPTVELGTSGENRRHLTALVLARGQGTLIQLGRPTGTPGTVAAGERLLLIDHAGRSVAVLEVDAVEHTTVAGLSRSGAPDEDTHPEGTDLWVAPPSDRPAIASSRRAPQTSVACVHFHIVGHEEAQASPGRRPADPPRQEGLIPEE